MMEIKNSQVENFQDEKNTTESDPEYLKDIQMKGKSSKDKGTSNQSKFNLVLKQKLLVKKKIQKLFRQKTMFKIDKEIERAKKNQNQIQRFQKKYPLTFQKSFQAQSNMNLKPKFFVKLSAEDMTRFPLDDYEYDLQDLKREEEIIRSSNVVRVIDVLKIIDCQIKLKGNSTFIYEVKIQKTIPFHIFSEVVFVTQSYFKLDQIKLNFHKIQTQEEKEEYFQREFSGVSQKDHRSFYQKSH